MFADYSHLSTAMLLPVLTLKQKAERRIYRGHLWIFKDELESVPEGLPSGALVRILSPRGRSLGTGMYNSVSTITVRLLLSETEELSTEFFSERLLRAKRYRELLLPDEETYRAVFGESDLLPGLIADKYGDYFAIQTFSAGMDAAKDAIATAIRTVFPETKGIIEKNETRMRLLEGLSAIEQTLWGEIPETLITAENGLKLCIDLAGGQKTGYFLDQRPNRAEVRRLAAGRRTLDCFTNQGGFALNAALGGATEVIGVDISQSAVDACNRNAELNGIANAQFVKEDAFGFLKNAAKSGENYDLIILDPPAFTKSKKNIAQAVRGYAEINRLALKMLPPGGLLATASCSHHISEELFVETVQQQAASLYKRLRFVYRGMQSPDHPVLLGMPETRYLKFFIFEVI